MFTTSQEALDSAVREDQISENLLNLAKGYQRDGKLERAKKLEELAKRRFANMLDDFGDALRLEAEGR